MITKMTPSRAVVRASTASTYAGFYLRDNLAATGAVPASPPYNQCPDIIQSSTPITAPQDTLSTLESWGETYNTEPAAGQNYYYIRGLNGGPAAFDGSVSLFWTPAELILFPSLWKNNPLSTQSGRETVVISAAPGHIGVGGDPFLLKWPAPSARSGTSTFTSFVAQNTAVAIPTISSWIEMSQLMTQQLNFGCRNGASFDPVANEGTMLERLGFNIPTSVGQSGTLQFILTCNGLVGDTVALIMDRYTMEQKSVQIAPSKVTQDGQAFGTQAVIDPGFSSSVAIQYWNTSNQVPAAGATLTLSVNYVVPKQQIETAVAAGVLDSRYAQAVARQLGEGVNPQAVAPVGSVTFVALPSGP